MKKKGPRARKPAEATMAAKVLQYAADHPDAGPKVIAEVLSCHPTYASQVMRKYGPPKPKAFTGGTRLTSGQSNGESDLASITAQMRTLRKIGWPQVRQLLALHDALAEK
jgi:hypothetical protein